MAKKYPLEQLAIIKKKKLEEAERILREKKENLIQEEEKLTTVEKARDKAKKHKVDKLEQLRGALDEGERTDKIEQKRIYLKLVNEKLSQHEKKVADQQKQVEKAEEEVEKARQEMLKKTRDVEKLQEHKKEWKVEMRRELEKDEAIEGDEMGGARFIADKRKKKRK